METMHERCAGLDVHKDTVVACVRIASKSVGAAGSEDVRDHDERTSRLA